MVFSPINFLDFHEIFINELFGSLILFLIVVLVVIFIVSLRFRIPFEVSGVLGILFLLIVSYSYNIAAFMTTLIFGIGVFFFWMYARKMRTG